MTLRTTNPVGTIATIATAAGVLPAGNVTGDARFNALCAAVLALEVAPDGFTTSDLAAAKEAARRLRRDR